MYIILGAYAWQCTIISTQHVILWLFYGAWLSLQIVRKPECRAVDLKLPRRETRWILQECPKLVNRSQPLVGRSSPYYQDMWRRYCCLTRFFPIVDKCLSCEDIAWQSCAMVPRWRFFASCISSEPRSIVSDMHSKFALGPRRVWKYGRNPMCDGWD